jgi:hypothetical protein
MDEKAKSEAAGLAESEGLEGLGERFRQWRETRRRGDRIPPKLWAAAVDSAREHGVPRVANRLRLNADFLSKRLAAAGQPQTEAAGPEFVELLTVPTATAAAVVGVHECVVELHNVRGAKMRIELNAGGLAGLTHLCRAFWSAA